MATATGQPETKPPHGERTASSRQGFFHKLKSWYILAGVSFLNALLFLVLLNLVLYAILQLRRPAPSRDPIAQHLPADRLQKAYPGWTEEDVKTLLRETPRADREFEYEPLTGFRERPSRGKFVNVDPASFRLSKNQAPWPPRPGTTNVFVFGGSTAFGYYLPDNETIPSYLQEYLSQHGHGPFAIYNFARPAYISSQELALFQRLLREGHVPQVAIFIDGLNDFIFADGTPKFTGELRSFMNGEVNTNPLNNIPMIRAAHALAYRWNRPASTAEQSSAADYDNPATLYEVVNRWLANKKMIELTAAGYGVRTVFVWQPIPVYKYDLRYHLFLHSDNAFGGFVRAKYGYPIMAEASGQGKLGPDLLWLADMQQDKHQNLYVDSVHYSAAFSEEIADRIGDFVLGKSPAAEHPSKPDTALR